MKKIAPRSDSQAALRAFTESDDEGAFRLFARLCRASPALREWLWEEFARKPKTRAKVAAALVKEANLGEVAAFAPDNVRMTRQSIEVAFVLPAASVERQMPRGIERGEWRQ